MRKYLILAVIMFLALPPVFVFAQGHTSERELRIEELERKERALRKRIEEKKPPPEVEEKVPAPVPPAAPPEKVLIKSIKVSGVTLIPEKEIRAITQPFENKELTLKEMYEITDRITDAYRQRSYITSRAYIPPQRIEGGILEILVIEGLTGEATVKGNRYFKSRLLLGWISLKKGRPFDYSVLRKDMSKINENRDIFARAVLVPGKKPGQTDIVLDVKDRLPIHAGVGWDTYGSRYIGKDRYGVNLSHNNLLGFGDSVNFQYQLGQHSRYFLKNIIYLLPLSGAWKIGASALFSRVKLGEEFEDLDVRGKAEIYSVFANNSLIDKENFDLRLNFGFDHKDIINHQQQTAVSHDRLRVGKIGLDMDITDPIGRTLVTHEFDYGFPNIIGGMEAKDGSASRSGAGGRFLKNVFNIYRLQNLPFSTTVLWKNQIQISPYSLTSAEQFQIGGIANVRGYGPAEAVGDRGYASTAELSVPVYIVPRQIKVPFSKARLYNALRVAAFYDWGNTHLRRPGTGEHQSRTLRSVGWGARFNLPEDLSFKIDFGWPLDGTPSDGDHLHTWMRFSKDF